ncbi:MAG: hypothetical protein HLUCCO18_07155 [Rhodobacteraceae bacterium HLUCCO18]|nr:MAG: hypothetical protein HLUCCO18_07155 [Rhodobacteraceae bacterium HLUCCO18]
MLFCFSAAREDILGVAKGITSESTRQMPETWATGRNWICVW